MADSKLELSSIQELSENSDQKDAEKEKGTPSLITHKLNKHSRTRPQPLLDSRTDPRMVAIELYNQRHPKSLPPSDCVSTSQASLTQAHIEQQATIIAQASNVFLMAAQQAVPEVASTSIVADEHKIANIWFELFALDIDIKTTIREELQNASILVQSFHCMHLLRNYERNNPPQQQTIRVYLINQTAYMVEATKKYFKRKTDHLYRVIVQYEMESRCCFFSKPIIHNPTDLQSNTEINIFLSDNTDLNFSSIFMVFDACKQKLFAQLAEHNESSETKSFNKSRT